MTDSTSTRQCPYCREKIKSEAIKCKHCNSSIAPSVLEHGGTCPYCKETIHKDAIKCKHCKSMLNTRIEDDCGCSGGAASNFERTQTSTAYSSVQNIDTLFDGSIQPEGMQKSYSLPLIFCRARCIEWSKLFPNICNRWIWDCTWGPIIIIWGSSQVAER